MCVWFGVYTYMCVCIEYRWLTKNQAGSYFTAFKLQQFYLTEASILSVECTRPTLASLFPNIVSAFSVHIDEIGACTGSSQCSKRGSKLLSIISDMLI